MPSRCLVEPFLRLSSLQFRTSCKCGVIATILGATKNHGHTRIVQRCITGAGSSWQDKIVAIDATLDEYSKTIQIEECHVDHDGKHMNSSDCCKAFFLVSPVDHKIDVWLSFPIIGRTNNKLSTFDYIR